MILFVVGTRPNFIKAGPLVIECVKRGIPHRLYNSYQHEARMQVVKVAENNTAEFKDLGRTEKFAHIMQDFNSYVKATAPKIIVIFGDVDTSLACALVAVTNNIAVVHVEAGVRSGYTMPEEGNRRCIDAMSLIKFAPTKNAMDNLRDEGLGSGSFHVGNIMIEALIGTHGTERSVARNRYVLVEIHRAENDHKLESIMEAVNSLGYDVQWLKHPRYEYTKEFDNITFLEVQDYKKTLELVANASLVLTDSGGLQNDASFLWVPVVTFRQNTEWMCTVNKGINVLVTDMSILRDVMLTHIHTKSSPDFAEELWDDKVSKRIIDELENYFDWNTN